MQGKNKRRNVVLTIAFTIGLAGLLAPPAAQAETCLSVSRSGMESFGTTYELVVNNSCTHSVFARYIFDDGSLGFTSSHSGVASVSPGFSSSIRINLSGTPAGTRSPSISFSEGAPSYGSPRFSLSSYTIRESPSRPSTPSLPVRPVIPARPVIPSCSSVTQPAAAVGKQVAAEEAEFTWQLVPGTLSYQIRESRWDGSQWINGEWTDVGNVTSRRVAFSGAVSVVLYVAANCTGAWSIPPSNVVSKGPGSIALPNLGADWQCSATVADTAICTTTRFVTKKRARNVSSLVQESLSSARSTFTAAGLTPKSPPTVTATRSGKGVTIIVMAAFPARRTFP